VEYLVGQKKRYRATVRLGQETNTYDAEGEIVSDIPVDVTYDELSAALARFRGQIWQQPPPFSAIKVDGQPLYKRARRGEVTVTSARQVTVFELNLISWESPLVELELTCSSGTYVRSIAHDLGRDLGCGGYIARLHRVSIGEFSDNESVPLDGLNRENWQKYLMNMDVTVKHLPRIDVPVELAIKLSHGQSVPANDGGEETNLVRAYDDEGSFVGIAVLDGDRWRAKKIFYQPDD
jgi:tRNA pseudouridine55 synthase